MSALWHSLGWLLRRGRTGLGSLLLGIALFLLIQPVAIKSFGNLDRLQPFLELVPPSFWALMNVTPDFLSTVGLAGYLSLGFTHPVYHILSATTVIWFACRSLAAEMERGTIQFALARPLSRPHLYASRVLAVLVVATLIALVGPLGLVVGMGLARPEGAFDYAHLLPTAAAAWLLVWAIGGLTLFGSAAADSMGRAVGWAIAGLVVSYVIDYFAALWSALEPLEPLSVFDYYDPAVALANGTLPVAHVVVLGLVGIVGAVAGLVVFTRRDLPV